MLQGDSGLDYKAYANMFRDNSSDGGGNTASNYGKTIRAAVGSNNLDVKMVKNIDTGGASEDSCHLVESHDNYANGDKESTGLTDYQIMMGWAVVGSRRPALRCTSTVRRLWRHQPAVRRAVPAG